MKKMMMVLMLLVLTVSGVSLAAPDLVWGVNSQATGAELINLDPFTGAVYQTYALPGISPNDTEIGLAGWSNALYYVNSNVNAGLVTVINPLDGSTVGTFSVSGGWEIDGLGYWSGAEGSFLYTSGCSVDDMHRYNAADGANPQFYWSDSDDPQAMAGDNGGRVFTYSTTEAGGQWGIYEVDPVSDTSLTWFAASPSDSIVGMAYDGSYLYLSDLGGNLYTLNNNGTLVNTLNLGYTLYALGSTEGRPYIIPAPGAVLLGSIGAGMVGWLRRRRAL